MAEWGASSSGHIPWSAPLLVTSAGALAALSNSSVGRDPILGSALTLAAQSIGVGAALWIFSAFIAVVLPGAVDDPSLRSQLWGVVFVAGPLTIGAALFAGRFRRVAPEFQISVIQVTLARLDRELQEISPRVNNKSASLARARWAAWGPVALAWMTATCGLVVVLYHGAHPKPREAAIAVVMFWTFWAVSAAAVGAIRVVWNQPRGWLWRLDRPACRRTPTPWCLALCTILIGLAVGSVVILTTALLVQYSRVDFDIRWAYAGVYVGGSAALIVTVLWRRRGTNHWATISYLKIVRQRNRSAERLRATQALVAQRQRDERSERRRRRRDKLLGWFDV